MSSPEGFFGGNEPDRDAFDERLHPLRKIFHARLLGDHVAQHNESFRYTERRGVGDVFHIVKTSIGFLLFAADHDIGLGGHSRSGVTRAQEDFADLGLWISYAAKRSRSR